MRNFEERKAEVFRRSEKRIKERIRKRNSIMAAGIPMCLVFIVLSIISFPEIETATTPDVHEEVTEGAYSNLYGEKLGSAAGAHKDGGIGSDTAGTEYTFAYEEESVSFVSHYIRTDGYNEDVEYPKVKIIRSVKELQEYYEANKDKYDLERKGKVYSDTTIGFLDACDKYDEEYFENQILLMVLLEEGSGSVGHNVENVKVLQDEKLYISICAIVPEVGTCDMAEWHILIETEKGIDVTNEEEVIVDVYAKYQ